MKFNNIRVYQLHDDFQYPHDIAKQLAEYPYRECEPSHPKSMGFLPDPLFTQRGVVIACRFQEKVVSKDEIEKRLVAIERERGAPLNRKHRAMETDNIKAQLLPHAPSKFRTIYAILQPKRILIFTTSATQCEDVLGMLRMVFGSLPVRPWNVGHDARKMMTEWLRDEPPQGYDLGESTKLEGNTDDDDSTIVIRHEDLTRDEIKTQLMLGKECSELELIHGSEYRFTLRGDFSIKAFDMLIDEPEYDDEEYRVALVEWVVPYIEKIITDVDSAVQSGEQSGGEV